MADAVPAPAERRGADLEAIRGRHAEYAGVTDRRLMAELFEEAWGDIATLLEEIARKDNLIYDAEQVLRRALSGPTQEGARE